MNNYQNMQSGQAMLKDAYSPVQEMSSNALVEALRQRRKRLAETKIGSMYDEPMEQSNAYSELAVRRRGL